MPAPRLFLVAPDLPPAHIAACLRAACEAGDVASLLVPLAAAREIVSAARPLDVAVLTTGEPREALRAGCDGLHVEAEDADYASLRAALGRNAILGAYVGGSRHLAMEAAEAGADYVAFDQHATLGGEPVIAWWSTLFEVPCVAFVAVTLQELDILLPQNPDFIRPDDAMWESAGEAARIVSELTKRLEKS
jgi:thiamine-phosphate pyrophosphorylase